MLVGLTAAAGAFAAAAMISAAVSPTARADDLSDMLANIQAEQAVAQADFSAASAEFASGSAGVPAGLTDWFEGFDDDTFGVAYDLDRGSLDALYNVPVVPADTFEVGGSKIPFPTPDNFTDAVTEAQTAYNLGNTDMTTYATDFSMGDYTDGEVYNDRGALDFFVIPGQIEFIGEVEQLMALIPGT